MRCLRRKRHTACAGQTLRYGPCKHARRVVVHIDLRAETIGGIGKVEILLAAVEGKLIGHLPFSIDRSERRLAARLEDEDAREARLEAANEEVAILVDGEARDQIRLKA